jgi:hypothetical protein
MPIQNSQVPVRILKRGEVLSDIDRQNISPVQTQISQIIPQVSSVSPMMPTASTTNIPRVPAVPQAQHTLNPTSSFDSNSHVNTPNSQDLNPNVSSSSIQSSTETRIPELSCKSQIPNSQDLNTGNRIANPISVNSSKAFSRQPTALDLFSGTGSVKRGLEKLGFLVTTLDCDPKTNPDILTDILDWNYQNGFHPGQFDLIAASPPCNEYSYAKTVQPRNLKKADQVVNKTLEILSWFKPKAWWIENPRMGYLKSRPFMQNIPFIDIDYCQFSDWGYQKPTRFWVSESLSSVPSKKCDFKTCTNLVDGPYGKCHRERLGGMGMKYGTKAKYRIPEDVVEYLLSAFQDFQWQKVTNKPKKHVQFSDDLVSSENEEGKVSIPKRLLMQACQYRVGRVKTLGDEKQLCMNVLAILPNGDRKPIKVLIDTGAEANLIKRGLISSECFTSARSPVNLVAANGQVLEGGKREICLKFDLRQIRDGNELKDKYRCKTSFFEADIQVDAILGYPWLKETGLGIFAIYGALALDKPFTLLYGIRKGLLKVLKKPQNLPSVNVISQKDEDTILEKLPNCGKFVTGNGIWNGSRKTEVFTIESTRNIRRG